MEHWPERPVAAIVANRTLSTAKNAVEAAPINTRSPRIIFTLSTVTQFDYSKTSVKAFAILFIFAFCISCKRAPSGSAPPPIPSAARIGFVDLPPLAQLEVTNAIFKEGSVARKLEDYIDTQVAHVEVERRGLRVLRVDSRLAAIPKDQTQAGDLIAPSLLRFRNYRYYYAVVFASKGRGSVGSAVLLGANSPAEMERLGERLAADPDSVCGPAAKNCTVFPQTCTVALQMGIVVNGGPQVVGWRTTLANVAPAGKAVKWTRGGVVTDFAAGEAKLRATVLLPGDQVEWE